MIPDGWISMRMSCEETQCPIFWLLKGGRTTDRKEKRRVCVDGSSPIFGLRCVLCLAHAKHEGMWLAAREAKAARASPRKGQCLLDRARGDLRSLSIAHCQVHSISVSGGRISPRGSDKHLLCSSQLSYSDSLSYALAKTTILIFISRRLSLRIEYGSSFPAKDV